MNNIKTEISYSDYMFLTEIKSEEIPLEAFNTMILDTFKCPELYNEMLENNKCPICGSTLEIKSNNNYYEDYEYQGDKIINKEYILKCNNCGISHEYQDT